jgi:hypothetical protein
MRLQCGAVSDDEPSYSRTHRPKAPRTVPRPDELLFEFVRESDHAHFRCELRYQGEYGVEAQFLCDGSLLIGRLFTAWMDPQRRARELAIAWAEDERQALERR